MFARFEHAFTLSRIFALEALPSSFVSSSDLDETLDKWDNDVTQKLLGNRLTDFKRLNNCSFVFILSQFNSSVNRIMYNCILFI